MAFISTLVGTLPNTGIQDLFMFTPGQSIGKMRTTAVPPDGGTAIASSCNGFAKDGTQYVSSFGRDSTSSTKLRKDDRCIHIFDQDEQGGSTDILDVEFVSFTELAPGFTKITFDVHKVNTNWSIMLDLYE